MLFVVTGPESSGKSTLAAALARQLNAPHAGEAARTYLQDMAAYQPSDLLNIALQQQALERVVLASEPSVAIADTDLQVICLWWQERFGPVPEVLRKAYAQQTPRHYLLCRPDLPWVADPLRENPEDRERLWQIYLADLSARQLAYSVVQGEGQQRLDSALQGISQALSASQQ